LTVAIKLNDQFTAPLRDIQKETSNTFDENRQGSFLSGIKASTVALAGMATAGVAAVGAGLTSAFNQAREFEAAMGDVSAATRASSEDMDALAQLARDMGATTSFSAIEAAEGIQMLGMAGLSTDQIMSALPSTLSLAAAGGLELSAASDIATNIMDGLGLEAKDLTSIVDKLAITASNSNTNVEGLGEAFKMVASTGATAGVDIDDLSASLGLLASRGMSGSIGGTSLNAALRAMINPSGEAQKAIDRLGLTFMDSNDQMLPMADILDQLEEKQLSAKDTFEIFGTEGARAISGLRGAGVENLNAFIDKLQETGAASDMANRRLNTFDGASRMLSSALSELSISIGEQILPMATALINDFLLPAITNTNEFIKSVGGFGQMFSDALAVIVGFKNTAINVLNELLNNADFAKNFLGNLGGIFNAALNLVTNFAVGTSGQGGMYGIIIELAKIVWEPLKQAFLAFWDFIKQPLVDGVNFISQSFATGINGIIDSFNDLGEYIGVTIDNIDFDPITVDASKTFKERWAEGSANVRESLDNIKGFASDMGDALEADTNRVTGAIAETAESASHLVDEGMSEVIVKYDQVIGRVEDSAKDDGEKIGQELGEGVQVGFVPQMEVVGTEASISLTNSLKEHFGEKKNEIGKALQSAMAEGIRTGDFESTFIGLGEQIGGILGGPIGAAVGGKLAQAASSVIFNGPSAAQRATGAFGAILQGFEAASGQLAETGGFQGVLEGLYTKEGEATASFTRGGGQKLANQFKAFGLSEEATRLLLFNLIPKLRRGEQLPGAELRMVQDELREALITQEVADIEAAQRAQAFEEGITGEAERRLNLVEAANGYDGMVGGPTLFLAGEEGPEQVNITPASRMRGGFAGSGGNNYHFNFSVSAIDEKSVKSFIETDAKDFIVNMLQRESTRGRSVMYNTGLVADPSV
jgi:TP901 family phage tail tape measure protein